MKKSAVALALLALAALDCSVDKATIALLDDPTLGGGTSALDATGAAGGAAGSAGAPALDANSGGTAGTEGVDASNFECTDDGACAAPRPRCNLLTHSCVACVSALDCTTRFCSADNTCLRCSGAQDCSAGYHYCDLDEGRCEQCRSAMDCAPDQVCSAEPRTCVARCFTDADCAGGDHPVCARSSGICVECALATDCPGEQPACDARLGRCVRCTTNADCDGGYCSPTEHECEEHFASGD